ncbi:MAG: filamentous hemagglutinin N-terminal domain-containing protein [Gammaproteobacteria bacterium]|nr:filamentous hemagglutinin N-terminal domain-containing protein [Gammaproteobacteria bacterium]
MDNVHKIPYKQILPVIIGSASLYCVSPGVNADVTFDTSFGGTADTLNGSTMEITADRGRLAGNNLFHSFSEFNVNTGQTANFSGPNNVQNIFSRVTGSNPSSIDGTISSSIQGANLFLMNPNGMMFGPNAQINISGSFHATTADYISFGNQERFYADINRDSTLSVAAPSAFGFLDDSVSDITIDGSQLNAIDGAGITISAGDIEITTGSTVSVPDGQISLSSVKSDGEVNLDPQQTDLGTFSELGSISINNASTVSVTGTFGGRVVIRGGQLTVGASYVSADTEVYAMQMESNIDIDTRESITVDNGGKISADLKEFADGTPTGIQLKTDNLNISNGSSIQSLAEFLSFGNAGNINVDAKHIMLDNYSQVSTSTFSMGDSGNITIDSTDTIDIQNASSIKSGADWLFGEGKSGDITISTNNLQITGLEDPFDIAITDFTGINAGLSIINGNDAGNITINANNMSLDQNAAISTWTSGGYKSGDINIQSQYLRIEGGSYIQTFSSDNGYAGAINITSEELVISGVSPNPDALFGGYNFSRIVRTGSGESNISLNSQNIYVLDGGKIYSDSSVSSFTSGNIHVRANQITISGVNQLAYEHSLNSGNSETTALHEAQSLMSSSLYAETYYDEPQSTYNAGSIYIEANNFALEDGAAIRANADGFESSENSKLKEGGNIEILFNEGRISDSTVSATSFAANGGNIQLVGTESMLLQNSNIKTSVQSAEGNGGNIDIKSGFLLLNGNSITATAYAGAGGNIDVYATNMLILDNNIIDASSELSVDGIINIDSELDLNNSLEKLPDSKIDPASQFSKNCQFDDFKHKSILSNNVKSQPIVTNSYSLPSNYDYNLTIADTAILQPIDDENNMYITMLIDQTNNKCMQ